jgi:hypothetical protein
MFSMSSEDLSPPTSLAAITPGAKRVVPATTRGWIYWRFAYRYIRKVEENSAICWSAQRRHQKGKHRSQHNEEKLGNINVRLTSL